MRFSCACLGCPGCNHQATRPTGCARRPHVPGKCRTCADMDRQIGWPPAVTKFDPPTLEAFPTQAGRDD